MARAVLAMLTGLGVIAGLGRAPSGWAQSKRYPPEPVDKDAEQAARSKMWSSALMPERHSYQDLVKTAAAALAQRTTDQTLAAIKLLDAAVKLLPREADAYR